MKVFLFLLITLSFSINLYSQKNENSFENSDSLNLFIIKCIKSIEKTSSYKYYKITGIILTTDKTGILTSYKLHFSDKKIKLNRKEYSVLYNLLMKKNYYSILIDYCDYPEECLQLKYGLSLKNRILSSETTPTQPQPHK